MEYKSFKLNLDTELYDTLKSLGLASGIRMDQLIINAVSTYVKQEYKALKPNLESKLQRISQYATNDPKFEDAIVAFAEAETKYKDPVEGTIVKPVSETQTEIRGLLDNAHE